MAKNVGVESVTHHNHLWGFQDDALTSAPQAARRSLPKTEWDKENWLKKIKKSAFIKKKKAAHIYFLLKIKKRFWVLTQDGRQIIQCMPDSTHNSWPNTSTCGTEHQYRMLNRAALNGQFPLSAQTTPTRGETPAAGKVHSHDVTTFTVRLAPNEGGEPQSIKTQQTQKRLKEGQQPWKHQTQGDPTFGFDEECGLCPTPN